MDSLLQEAEVGSSSLENYQEKCWAGRDDWEMGEAFLRYAGNK